MVPSGLVPFSFALLAASLAVFFTDFVLAAGGDGGEGSGPPGGIRFADVTQDAGLAGLRLLAGRPGKDHLLDSAGAGAAFLDFDRDGWLDIFLPNGWRIDGDKVVEKGRFALLRGGRDGKFEDVTERARVLGEGRWGAGVAAADYDGDGWTDILVTCFGPNLLYRNASDGTFEEVARSAGVESPGWNTGAAFFDADADGDLDLYIAGYIHCTLDDVLMARRTLDWKGLEKVAAGPFGMKGERDRFFRAIGGGRFVEATAEAGFEDKALAFGFGARAADYDGDGDVDLFVANDSDADYFFRNEGGGHFKEAGLFAGCALNAAGAAQASMGVATGDVNGDGNADIFVTTFAEDSSTLHLGLGGGLFSDATAAYGLSEPTYLPMFWGCALADLDLDGDLDLALAAGHIYPQVEGHPGTGQTYLQKIRLFENRGGAFADVSAAAGPALALPRSYRGLAVGDYDNDGDPDLLFTALDSSPLLLRNETKGGSWITVVPADERGPLSMVGARVLVSSGERKQSRDVAAGDSFLSTHDPRPAFGVGEADRVGEVEVRWPDGSRTLLQGVRPRQLLEARRPPRQPPRQPPRR
jgi:hypothetical protein